MGGNVFMSRFEDRKTFDSTSCYFNAELLGRFTYEIDEIEELQNEK